MSHALKLSSGLMSDVDPNFGPEGDIKCACQERSVRKFSWIHKTYGMWWHLKIRSYILQTSCSLEWRNSQKVNYLYMQSS